MKNYSFSYLLAGIFFLIVFQSCHKTETIGVKDEVTSLKDEAVPSKPQSENTLSNECDQANYYYWGDNRKIALTIDCSAMIFLPKDSVIVNKIRQGNSNTTLRRLRSSGYYFIETKDISDDIKTEIRTTATNSEFVFKTGGNHPFLVQTGEIVLKPKPGITIEGILKSIPAKLSVTINSIARNVYVIKVEDNVNSVALASAIYEKGDVEFSEPNFEADIELN